MSFEMVCTGCGAPSSPSVGMCPFCKTVMTFNDGKERPTINILTQYYNEGKLDRALSLGTEMLKAKPDLKSDLSFVMCFVKILIETEAPSSKIKSLLAEAFLFAPQDAEIMNYMEIVEAKNCLKKGLYDAGETMLKKIIRRSPQNVHAHFTLGAHLFWVDSESTLAIPHLETCVRLHENFLRAWGCLGAIYKKMGNEQLAQMAFQKCASIETNQNMKGFFLSQAKAS